MGFCRLISVAFLVATITKCGASSSPNFGLLSVGGHHTCFVDQLCQSPVLKCWGRNDAGQLGQGDDVSRGQSSQSLGASLPAVNLGQGFDPVQLSSGSDHTCALSSTGQIKCFGSNIAGQLGLGDFGSRGDHGNDMGDALPFLNLANRSAQAISTGIHHSCALLDDGTVKCWGYGAYGQLLTGHTDNVPLLGEALEPLSFGSGRNVTKIASGGYHNCVLLDDESVRCWGANGQAQLGLGDTVNRGGNSSDPLISSIPAIELGPGRRAVDLAAGGYHTCVILDDGSVKCWGRNDVGQLGQGNTETIGDEPLEVATMSAVDLGSGRRAKALALGLIHTCVVLDDDSLVCFGYGATGQLGLGSTGNHGDAPGHMGHNLPLLSLGQKVLTVKAGWYHTCAMLHDGSVRCFGNNLFGQLGVGSNVESRGARPTEMGAALQYVKLSTCTTDCVGCGGAAFCTIENAMTVQCNRCTTCSDSEWMVTECSQFGDATCQACTGGCPSGQYRGNCGGTKPGTCQPCSSCPDGAFMTKRCEALSDTQCSTCRVCGVHEYEISPCQSFSNATCGRCEDLKCNEGLVRVGCGDGSKGIAP